MEAIATCYRPAMGIWMFSGAKPEGAAWVGMSALPPRGAAGDIRSLQGPSQGRDLSEDRASQPGSTIGVVRPEGHCLQQGGHVVRNREGRQIDRDERMASEALPKPFPD